MNAWEMIETCRRRQDNTDANMAGELAICQCLRGAGWLGQDEVWEGLWLQSSTELGWAPIPVLRIKEDRWLTQTQELCQTNPKEITP